MSSAAEISSAAAGVSVTAVCIGSVTVVSGSVTAGGGVMSLMEVDTMSSPVVPVCTSADVPVTSSASDSMFVTAAAAKDRTVGVTAEQFAMLKDVIRSCPTNMTIPSTTGGTLQWPFVVVMDDGSGPDLDTTLVEGTDEIEVVNVETSSQASSLGRVCGLRAMESSGKVPIVAVKRMESVSVTVIADSDDVEEADDSVVPGTVEETVSANQNVTVDTVTVPVCSGSTVSSTATVTVPGEGTSSGVVRDAGASGCQLMLRGRLASLSSSEEDLGRSTPVLPSMLVSPLGAVAVTQLAYNAGNIAMMLYSSPDSPSPAEFSARQSGSFLEMYAVDIETVVVGVIASWQMLPVVVRLFYRESLKPDVDQFERLWSLDGDFLERARLWPVFVSPRVSDFHVGEVLAAVAKQLVSHLAHIPEEHVNTTARRVMADFTMLEGPVVQRLCFGVMAGMRLALGLTRRKATSDPREVLLHESTWDRVMAKPYSA